MWEICNHRLLPGTKKQVMLDPGIPDFQIPATLVCGAEPGKTLLLCGGTHPDEYPGIAALIQVGKELDPAQLRGNVVILHCLNITGFWAKNRRVPADGVNLNGDFPGKADGTPGQRLAYFAEAALYPHLDFILDLHSGSPMEPLEPCIFFPGHAGVRKAALAAAQSLSVRNLVESRSASGLYSYAAFRHGIPGLILERGHSGLCLSPWIREDIGDVYRLLHHLGCYDSPQLSPIITPHRIFTRTEYPEARQRGLWYPRVTPGQTVKKGQLLGQLTDFWGNPVDDLYALGDGLVFYLTGGLAVNPGDSLVAYGLE